MSQKIRILGHQFEANKAVLICDHVFFREAEITLIAHDKDGWIQCLCGKCDPDPKAAKTVGLSELYARLPSEMNLQLLSRGQYAIKTFPGWSIHEMDAE